MEHIAVPAILAYRAGEVFATLSGCVIKGLETTLRRYVKLPSMLREMSIVAKNKN